MRRPGSGVFRSRRRISMHRLKPQRGCLRILGCCDPSAMSAIQSLAGRRIAVTRARDQASELSGRLAALGAEVVELPLIHISKFVDKQTLADVLLELGGYDWVVFTSVN